MSSPRASWHAEDLVSAAVRVGDRPVHAFWPVLRESFRWILLPPHRRASGDTISWEWTAERAPPAPGSADFAALRERLDAALVNLSAQLDQRDDTSGALMGLRAVMESWVSGLMRSADSQLAAYAVATEAGWMIRSWGFPHPAKAVCMAGSDAGISKPAKLTASVDAQAGDHLSESRARRRRQRWLWCLAAAAAIAAIGLIARIQMEPIDVASKSTGPSTHENIFKPSAPAKKTVSSEPAIPVPSLASVDDSRDADALIKNSPRNRVTQAGPVSKGSGATGFSAVPAASPQSDPAFTGLFQSTAGQIRDSAVGRAIVVPGPDHGRGDLAAGAAPPSGPVDTPESAADMLLTPAAGSSLGRALGRVPANAETQQPSIASLSPRVAVTPAIAAVSDSPNASGMVPFDVTPKSSPKKTMPGSATNAPIPMATATLLPEADKPSAYPATIVADPSQAPVQTAVRALQVFSVEPTDRSGTTTLKSASSVKKSARDSLDDDPTDARMTSPGYAADESADKPSRSSSASANPTSQAGSGIAGSVALSEPVETGRMMVLLGEWRLVRVSDVVLATWPTEQATAQVLRTARNQAWAQMQAAVPASFREARVRTGWSLRLSASSFVPVPPVWRETTNGQPCADSWIRDDSILLGCTDRMTTVDRDARLIAADGREIARLTVSMKGRRFDVTMTPEVRMAAPWFTVALDPTEIPSGRFSWKSLRPEVGSDQAWKHWREAPDVGVICYPADTTHRGLPINGALAVIDSASGWALSRAITLQDNANKR